jgi:chromosomal replication initiator protein
MASESVAVAETAYNFIDDEVLDKTVIWEQLCALLEDEIGAGRMSSTFSRVVPLGITDEGEFIIGVPNEFNYSVISNMHLSEMSDLVNTISGYDGLTCKIVLDPTLAGPTERELVEEEVARERESSTASAPNVPATQFDPKFTFDSFVMGESNDLAYSASLAVAEAPGLKYNPLFIWGGPGLGKTHLLQAIGAYIEEYFPNKKIIYTTTEELMDKFINAVTEKTVDINWLRNEYRGTDVLIIDDIQALIGKTATIDFFFNTFNSLKQQHKQIVIASDRSPDELDLDERLTSRFKSGMLADIQSPSYEVRLSILQQYTKSFKIEFSPEALAYIAERSSGNIREMEGVGTRVSALAELREVSQVDLDFVEYATVGMFPDPANKPISIDAIIKETGNYYTLSKSDLVGKSRKSDIIHARHVAMFLCQDLTDASYPAIGRAFDGKDHTTVMHAVAKIRKRLSEDRDLYSQIQRLTTQINKRAI